MGGYSPGIQAARLAKEAVKEFFDIKGFRQVRINIKINCLHQVFGIVFVGNDDYRYGRAHLLDLSGKFQARQGRQGKAGQDQIRNILLEQIKRNPAILRSIEFSADWSKNVRDMEKYVRIILSKENGKPSQFNERVRCGGCFRDRQGLPL